MIDINQYTVAEDTYNGSEVTWLRFPYGREKIIAVKQINATYRNPKKLGM